VELGPAIEDLAGNAMPSAFQAHFRIDKTGAGVSGMTPAGTIADAVDHVEFTFDESIRRSTLGVPDLEISGPAAR
jgi:hypothetical protein